MRPLHPQGVAHAPHGQETAAKCCQLAEPTSPSAWQKMARQQQVAERKAAKSAAGGASQQPKARALKGRAAALKAESTKAAACSSSDSEDTVFGAKEDAGRNSKKQPQNAGPARAKRVRAV